MNTILKWVLVVLVVVALLLGYRIYSKNASRAGSAPITNQIDASAAPVPSAEAVGKPADANAILTPPSNTASDADKRAYADMLVGAAVRTTKIDISSCSPKPLVSSFTVDTNISLTNNDSIQHAIVFDPKNVFIVAPKSSKTVKADFGHGAGIYGYGCDDSRAAVGMMVVTK